ncbi:X-ray repair cross-complementing protein 5 [Camelus dromedarius]|uniref:X-ray repair cross-complementing protein 5 n=1 Tax=Camelus dromedarius TaxID=9838 RepID=A0A5N4E7I4_CAMDR|nr:X-ray repair cross-complementing protein 5 [Camelus dromedarius]
MARSGNKAAVVLCMDVGFAMSNSSPGGGSPFELAKKVMTMFVQRQVFAESKDEIALVLFGTDDTKNALAGEDQYQNITVHRHLLLPDFDLLEDIENKIQPGSQQADCILFQPEKSLKKFPSIWGILSPGCPYCVHGFDSTRNHKLKVGKKFNKKHIEVFTDLSSPFSKDQLDVIIHNLKKSGISLQFFLPFPVDKEDGTGDRGDGNLSLDHHGPSFPLKGITEQQKEGIQMVKKVMMSLEGEDGLDEIYSFSESLRQLCVFKKTERSSVPWHCQLTIGSNLSIKIVAYKSILQEKTKKSWTVVDARTLKKEDIRKETVFCLNDDDETEVPKEDTIQGFRYGSDIIPFSKVDQEQMKYKSEGKCFSVLGFCRSSQVHRKYFMGNQVLKVFAAKDDEVSWQRAAVALSPDSCFGELDMVAVVRYAYDRRANPQVGVAFSISRTPMRNLLWQKWNEKEAAAVALSSLIHALDELDMVAVVRYAYDRRANPQCLVYIQLPFMEDLRQYMFSSLQNKKKCTPTGTVKDPRIALQLLTTELLNESAE